MERTTQFVGQSGAFLDSVERASRAAALNRPVLVIGERGTGKELIAERLHRLSQRWDGPFITMNCAALAETLIEAELFGHEAGAFTGATKAREGRFEEADGGTLFLDELATLSSGAQERLLRAVEYGEVTRIGSNRPINVDVRIVAATNEHLPALVEKGRFRADLLDRLAFEVVTLPPLRVREGDIPVLADHFGRKMAAEMDWPRWPGFSKRVSDQMTVYSWPGNVRELRNVIERAVYRWERTEEAIDEIEFDPFASPWRVSEPIAPSEEFGVGHAPHVQGSSGGRSDPKLASTELEPESPTGPGLRRGDEAVVDCLRTAVASHEKALLEAALSKHRFNQRAAAKALNLTYDQLRHCLRKHGLLERAVSLTD